MPYGITNDGTRAMTARGFGMTGRASMMCENQLEEHVALIAAELYRLRIAYPTQARNFTDEETRMTNELWVEIFAGVDAAVMHEAVNRFIFADRKGFFPSPGQIAGFVEQIEAERKEIIKMRHQQEHLERLLQAIKQESPQG